MKKLTKITALVLSLALILGMSALATEVNPSILVLTDNFADAEGSDGVLSWDNLKASATTAALPSTIATDTYFAPTEGVYKYYYNTGSAPVNVNGKIAIQDTAVRTSNGTSFAYTVPGTFDLDDAEDYALVAQVDYTPVQMNTISTYGHNGFAGAIVDKEYTYTDATSGDQVTLKEGKMYELFVGGKSIAATETTPKYFNFIGGRLDCTKNTDTAYGAKIVEGETDTLTFVARRQLWTGSDENKTEYTDMGEIAVVSYSNYDTLRNGYHASYDSGSKKYEITAIHGFHYTSPKGVRSEWSNFKMYKVAMDTSTYAINADAMTTANIDVENSFEIITNVPVSKSIYAYAVPPGDVRPYFTVTKGEGDDAVELTYGEDYTIEIDEVINESSVIGSIKVIPADSWDFDTTYKVKIPANAMTTARTRATNIANKTVSFETEKAPTYDVTLKAYKGRSAAGAEIDALGEGTTYFVVEAVYADGKVAANGTLRLEIKDAEGNFVKAVTREKALGTSSASFAAAFNIKAGQSVTASIDGGIVGSATID